jgi:hypothetical protein
MARWDFQQIVPAHFQTPISASDGFKRPLFLKMILSTFSNNDLAELKPIADIALRTISDSFEV